VKNVLQLVAIIAVVFLVVDHAQAARKNCARNGMGDIECCKSNENLYKNGMGDVICESRALKCAKNGMGDIQCCKRNEKMFRNGMGDIVCH
jgi:hypothetical protein